MSAAPSYEEFAAPVAGGAPADTALGALPAGEYAVLAWLDEMAEHPSARAEADLTDGWDTVSLRGAYEKLFHRSGDAAMTVRAGLDLDTVRRLFEEEIGRGVQTGVQLSVSHAGQVVDLAVGDNGAGGELTTDTRVPWTCSSKPIGALALAAAWESGAIGLDTRVHEVLPEFVGGGKEAVRVRDLLTHTTGLPEPLTSVDPSGAQINSWEDVEDLLWSVIRSAETRTLPGTSMSYNAITNWFVLDRLLAAVGGSASGDSYRSMFDRLGLKTATLGADWSLPAEQRVTVRAAADQEAGLQTMNLVSALPLPGAGVWGTMSDLRVVGDVLLAGGKHGDTAVAGSATVEALTSTHWPGTPRKSICDTDFPYGLGIMTLPSVFGRRCSFRTYGHAGGNTSTLLVDPLFDLVVAVYWNGRLNDVKTFARRYALVRALYDDLGLPRLPHRGSR
ncbi:serine hydrolase domain-containing protein [Actinokineospora auranticolor]|uniref:CubicO group peptidase (Beta-lactamase class C family) n=1 Tax=Actinokineospora auranticolor TaxID=155976 RepID=A0A2S6H197_9PSEU|nr:serine hydrolase domain-containing protein [Actinokineospora auranticolor]PPK71187.1 CubicO group peptidase (beta-lactamase class C family) [Actinokineospora auranticolor]